MSVYGEVKQRKRNDEYYTKYEHVTDIFERYIPKGYCKDKIIYCPCDSEESNFVKYLKDNKDKLEYKELVYTWDDYNTHYDIFEYADVIITNPPFSKMLKEFFPILNKCKKDFFIFGSLINTPNYYNLCKDYDYKYICDNKIKRYSFVTPEGIDKWVMYIYITNIDSIDSENSYNPFHSNKDKYTLVKVGNRIIRNYDYMKYIPLDYYDELLCPFSVIFDHYRKDFDILKLNEPIEYLDGKPRYVRMLVKRKNI